jgi:hypothetical protein
VKLTSINSSVSPKISIGEITATTSRINMGCRLSTISFEGGASVEAYIKDALINEIKAAGIHSDSATKKLSANIDYINLDTFNAAEFITPMAQRFAEAKWHITMTFKGDGIDPFTIPSIHMSPLRDGFFDWGDPCDNPSRQFGPAVANMINILVNHPSFKEFVTK